MLLGGVGIRFFIDLWLLEKNITEQNKTFHMIKILSCWNILYLILELRVAKEIISNTAILARADGLDICSQEYF